MVVAAVDDVTPSSSAGRNGEPDAGDGGAGAPPEQYEANRAAPDLTKAYVGRGIRVRWYASRCIHSAECIRALPLVFDPQRRPWVDIDAADADAIAGAVQRCPTGALHFDRLDGGPAEAVPDTIEIRAIRNGPYFVRGMVDVLDDDGRVLRRDFRIALCRCGKSKHLPMCDNTHRMTGFRSEP